MTQLIYGNTPDARPTSRVVPLRIFITGHSQQEGVLRTFDQNP